MSKAPLPPYLWKLPEQTLQSSIILPGYDEFPELQHTQQRDLEIRLEIRLMECLAELQQLRDTHNLLVEMVHELLDDKRNYQFTQAFEKRW